MNLRTSLIALSSIGIMISLNGCGSLLAPQSAPLTYRLSSDTVVQPSAPAQTRFPYTLQVATPQSEAGFNTSSIAYRQQPYRLDYYTQSRWVDQPAILLGEQMTLALEQSGTYRVVLAPNISLPADLRLITELIALEQVFNDNTTGNSTLRFAMRMQLVDTRNSTILASSQINLSQTAPSADALGAVSAANAVMHEAMPKIVAFCIDNTPKAMNAASTEPTPAK
jgi:cholesterol transport system auxiliary component